MLRNKVDNLVAHALDLFRRPLPARPENHHRFRMFFTSRRLRHRSCTSWVHSQRPRTSWGVLGPREWPVNRAISVSRDIHHEIVDTGKTTRVTESMHAVAVVVNTVASVQDVICAI